jgi:hypothetical protein
MPPTNQNRSANALAIKVRAYQSHTLVIFRSCFLLRAEEVEKAHKVVAVDETLHHISI